MNVETGYSTQTVTQEPAVLKLRLRAQVDELAKEKESLNERVHGLVQRIGSATSSNENSPVLGDLDLNEFVLIDTKTNAEKNQLAACQDQQSQLTHVQQEVSAELHVVGAQINEEVQLTLLQRQLQRIQENLRQIAKREGTTLISALTTGAVAVGAAVTGPAIIGSAAAVGVGAISANELLKILRRHFNDVGADDRLQAIDLALSEIEEKRRQAQECNERASKSLSRLSKTLEAVEKEIKSLEAPIQEADQKLNKVIQEAKANLQASSANLRLQKQYLERAMDSSTKALAVLMNQSRQLDLLRTKKYTIKDATDLNRVIEEINQTITGVQSSSKEAYGLQLDSSQNMLKAFELLSEFNRANANSYKLVLELQTVQEQLKVAQASVEEMKHGLEETKVTTKELKNELKTQHQLNADQGDVILVAQDQLTKHRESSQPLMESTFVGGYSAFGVGLAAGGLMLGPMGAIGGGLLGYLVLARKAAQVAHLARKALRSGVLNEDRLIFEKLEKDLATRRVKPEDPVSINGWFGPSQGSIFGTYTLKLAWNYASSLSKSFVGKEVIPVLKSAHAGYVLFQCGPLQTTLKFDLNNPDYHTYGAISVPHQMILCTILTKALEAHQITPQQVSSFLEQLNSLKVNFQEIVMIHPDSLGMTTLRRRCEQLMTVSDQVHR